MSAPSAKKTDTIRPEPTPRSMLDAFDRKILGALTVGAGISFAELGQTVGLSAPAVHDRVKKLCAAGFARAERRRCSMGLQPASRSQPLFISIPSAGGRRRSSCRSPACRRWKKFTGNGRHEHVGQGALRLKVARVKPSRASPCGPERGEHQELYRFVDLPRTPVIHFLECLQPLRKA
ncbi:Lrp/AsnC family transcriptional regulator [Nitratireductor thuwali]|uniref:Lrp/AsnC family transcriptional regulator n=1 Tax=Nitratireductor thuwali TaxID=2267699 RepID=UPI0030D18053